MHISYAVRFVRSVCIIIIFFFFIIYQRALATLFYNKIYGYEMKRNELQHLCEF